MKWYQGQSHPSKQESGCSESGRLIYTVKYSQVMEKCTAYTMVSMPFPRNISRETLVSLSVLSRPVVVPAVLCCRDSFSTEKCCIRPVRVSFAFM